jgi:diguanylate cyclase (GGDEF)-like protein
MTGVVFLKIIRSLTRTLEIVAASATRSISFALGFVRDCSRKRRSTPPHAQEQELRHETMLLHTALNNMSQGLSMFDGAGRLVVSNESYALLYGLSPDRIRLGMHLQEIVACRAAHGVSPVEPPDAYLRHHVARVTKGGIDNRIQELSDGRLMAVSHRPMPDGGWLSIHEDITEKHRNEQRIVYMAKHDALTDLPNRLQLRERMESLAARARRGDAFAVLYLDLDRFKQINDTHGHPTGDELLKAVAVRLKDCVREVDMVARLGGDEFAIVQTLIKGQAEASVLASRVIKTLAAPFPIEDLQISSGTTIGIALSPTDGTDPEELIKKADMALYRAKSEGRGGWCFFEPGMDARAQWRQSLEIGLRQALADGHIEVNYQPIADAQGSICCFEALACWRHPERGFVPPSEFIPVAEETGLIVPLGERVLRLACVKAMDWPDQIKVAVNLSPTLFKARGVGPMVESALASSGLPAKRLELEITESLLTQNHQEVSTILHWLRLLGVHIAMDDFGTGYSSLNNLLRFPIDKIKIDRSFIKNITTSDNCVAIVRAVASLRRSLGITITAEGIETIEQLEVVRREGCDEIQGYFISPPLSADATDAFLRERANARVGAA